MRIITTVFTSAALAMGAQAMAAPSDGSNGATQAGTHSKALTTPSRDLTRQRNPNAATPAIPYPGEGKAATPAEPSMKSDTSTDTSTDTGADTSGTTGTTGTGTTASGSATTSGSASASGSLSGSASGKDAMRTPR